MSTDATDVDRLPPAPDVPLSLRERIAAIQVAHSGCETFRDAGGPVTTVRIAPKWMMPPIVVVTSPQGARDVLTATYPAVDRDFPFMTEQQKLNGGSLLNFSHKEWVGRRRMLQPVFTTARIAELNEQMYDIATDAATSWRDGSEIDLDRESRRITMRVLGRTIMGFEPGSYTDELVDPLRRISKYIADRGRAPVKLPSWVPTRERRFAVKFNKVAHDLAAQILQDCRTDPQLSAPLVRAMMEARDPETSEPLTDEEICHELVIFLASGLETTATTLAHALWALGRHPEIFDRVAAEVAAVDEAALRTNPRSHLPYTVSVIQEALRLGGPTPAVMRIARQDMAVDGFRVEAGSMLMVGVYAMHRDPQLWDRPMEFDPDRFTAGRSRMQWQFLPFGGGPRSCIGEFFALTAATLELASIVRHCRLTSRSATFPITAPLTIVPDGPIPALVQTVNA
ncbi:cytochrome P450 [Mycolicibacterium sp. NCC-Tsukiji]|uniref:cytochrome P450 n=1 Tax=Mycolicibacterium sp. NCC-Tsukiji TaxID=2185272 RepID=UPI000EEBE38B|nr:cytochrome P450 [Mycolicibacterium sp. NCC-Tsukiji]GCB00310.1 cytochrome P450 [Mycolicibacterium sp. NCC-Tsukiji]